MSQREEKIVDAAFRVFSRYGAKRTTMNDIASEAGIARQTLYNVFSNKDDVLRASIRIYTDRSLAAIEAETADAESLGDKLDILFDHMVVRPFDILSAFPDADDLISGFNQAARDEIETSNERFRVAIEAMLKPYEKQIGKAGLSTSQLADFIRSSAKGFKHNVRNKKHLQQQLAALKVMALKVAEKA